MPYPVAVILPTRNEESTIEAAVRSAWAAGAAEVIVADGGSSDETLSRAGHAGASIIASGAVRGRQLNRAAETSLSEILLFLHGDSRLPERGLRLVAEAVQSGVVFGGFRVRFAELHPLMPLVASLINLRTRITRCPWGDQGQFVARVPFFLSGGFREYPLMEDYDLAIRMKRIGRTAILPEYVTTSGRRFLDNGFLRTAALNWKTVLQFRLGADPFELEKQYRK